MFAGITFALTAGLMWGLVFVMPLLLPDYPPALQSCGRYLAFGLITLPFAWIHRRALGQLSRADWKTALKLSVIGNLLYYLFLASAVQRAGGPMPTMIIGILPVAISLCANMLHHERDGLLPWEKLVPALLLILAGIACVNQIELATLSRAQHVDIAGYALGAVLALGALACWTWYPLRNASWLRAHPDRNPRTWAIAQGLVTLPLALIGYVVVLGGYGLTDHSFPIPFGPRPLPFVGLMLAAGLLASWLGTLCWNEASQRLPTALLGQLIVFETLAGLVYAYMLRHQWPEPLTCLGIALLVLGTLWAVKIKPEHREPAH